MVNATRGHRVWHFSLLALCALLLSGCGDPIGTPCKFSGSGFTASDNCRYRCLEHRTIHCPDDTVLAGPKVCSGQRQCNPGECPNGQTCYHVPDPFKKESYCIDSNLCGDYSAAELSAWELDAKRISDEKIAAWQAKQQRMQNKPTLPVDQ